MTDSRTRAALLALLITAAATSVACIESQTHATIVVEPNGSGRWMVLQHGARAVADTPDDRLREEKEFMAAVFADRHGEAAAFRALGATDVKTTVFSAEWPFAFHTEARFANLAEVFTAFFRAAGVDGQATLVRNGDRTTFTVVASTDECGESAADADGEIGRGLQSLLGDPAPTLFMRHGRFVSASGFVLSEDGRVARPDDIDDDRDSVTLSLTWVATEATTNRK